MPQLLTFTYDNNSFTNNKGKYGNIISFTEDNSSDSDSDDSDNDNYTGLYELVVDKSYAGLDTNDNIDIKIVSPDCYYIHYVKTKEDNYDCTYQVVFYDNNNNSLYKDNLKLYISLIMFYSAC